MAQNTGAGQILTTDNLVGRRTFIGNTTPAYPVTGDVWIDNTAGSAPNANFTTYTATGGETSVTVTYTVNFELVYLNGVKLVRGSDYVATTGTSITGLTALVANDIVEIVSFSSMLVNGMLALSTVTAKGDLIAATGNGAVTNFPLGTNGQALIVDTTTSTGLKWSHDATELPLSTVTAKGDIIVATASGAVTNVAVGGALQLLVPDSTQASGVRWGDDNQILTLMGASI
jgi:hypothetical protein